jgi:hypothetical protein
MEWNTICHAPQVVHDGEIHDRNLVLIPAVGKFPGVPFIFARLSIFPSLNNQQNQNHNENASRLLTRSRSMQVEIYQFQQFDVIQLQELGVGVQWIFTVVTRKCDTGRRRRRRNE